MQTTAVLTDTVARPGRDSGNICRHAAGRNLFVAAATAALACVECSVFLNATACVTSGWLPPVLDCLGNDPGLGAAGRACSLVTPDRLGQAPCLPRWGTALRRHCAAQRGQFLPLPVRVP